MIKIKSISNEDTAHHFKLEISPEMHNDLVSFFSELGFPDDETIKIDTIFTEISGEYIYLHKDDIKAHFFVEDKYVHMVIDWQIQQNELIEHMRKYFSF